MEPSKKIITVIGGGVIGRSWAALFAMRGDVIRIVEPDPVVAHTLKPIILTMIKDSLGISNAYGVERNIEVYDELDQAVDGAYAIQEAAPEKVEIKQAIFARVEALATSDAIILSSSGGIPTAILAAKMQDPSRLMIGHPCPPPHLMPLVEVAVSPQTGVELVEKALAFYRAYDKVPVLLRKQIPGFVADRLQAALVLEAAELIAQRVVNAEELDIIMKNSLGLRWATSGPILAAVLGDAREGLRHILTGLSRPLSEEVIEKLTRQAELFYPERNREALARQRDQQQKKIIRIQNQEGLFTIG